MEWRGVVWKGGAGPNVAADSYGALARRPMAAGVLNLNTSLNQVAGFFLEFQIVRNLGLKSMKVLKSMK